MAVWPLVGQKGDTDPDSRARQCWQDDAAVQTKDWRGGDYNPDDWLQRRVGYVPESQFQRLGTVVIPSLAPYCHSTILVATTLSLNPY